LWTAKAGNFTVEAELVSYADGKVKLQKADGKIVEVAMAKLSTADQKWVRDELRRRKAQATTDTRSTVSVAKMENEDWYQWRGPRRDGISLETGLLNEWPEDGPPKLWSSRGVGSGYASVSISGDRIYTMGNKDGGTQLFCLKLEDGSLVWQTPVGGGDNPNCTPTVDPESGLVYGLSHGGDLLCAKVDTGEKVWSVNYGRDFGGKMMSGWGYSESPLVDGDRLIVTPGGDKAVLAALDKKSGKPVWATAADGSGGAGYASPVISHGGGVKQYLTLVGRGLISVAADDGRVLWFYQRIANGTANIPTPIVKDDLVFTSTGYGDGGSALLQLVKDGRGVNYREIYYKKADELQNHHGGMVLLGEHVYMGHGHNNGFPVCVELKTGRVVWGPERGAGGNSAALVAADGNLYFRYENGVMALVAATPNGYELKGKFRIASVNGQSWPHPVIHHGKLYLRDQDELHCYDIAAK
jgi:outer membrane protein assembly factor BamB